MAHDLWQRLPMARTGKLKVFRTPIGFHDAYVAATSQKAALVAWGSDADLFTRGIAEVVTDAALTAEPLAKPGEVIRRLRGTAAEQIAEASKTSSAPTKATGQTKIEKGGASRPTPTVPPKKARKPKPRPSRAKLDEAEAALAEAENALRAEERRIADDISALTREREKLRGQSGKEITRLEAAKAKANAAYKRAMMKWQE